ncbi:isoprenylcysteine carboxylmethyltransferase family protein [Chelatococcus sp. SYSU_G07232]|uniref:Isoprenylcysteine carboxylmethyltransferase family protein n=1 Tax=Chelatococcus albus TaxID=3047466 RepID=A0ABT7AEG5_9HYPH|nr:isoprenylcysteine carboxylmethyltransferase family protein [Chelatococcus sp. SYSU_G07232]MDJ1157239.1 isoprenylcysteine carboxylmethyltransferase family protein [Chelatococcus sp. SYSU_G07232]
MSDISDRPNRLHWPPILYAGTLVAAGLLEWLYPLAPNGVWWGLRLAGAGLLVMGLALAVSGFNTFRRLGTPVDPTARAEVLATGGIYAVTRNPMYLGISIAFAGLGLASNWPWLLLLAPAMAIGLQKLAIEREERHLEARFGASYRAYRERVPRWFGPF